MKKRGSISYYYYSTKYAFTMDWGALTSKVVVVTGMDWWTEQWTKHDMVDYTIVVPTAEFGGHEVSFLSKKSTISTI